MVSLEERSDDAITLDFLNVVAERERERESSFYLQIKGQGRLASKVRTFETPSFVRYDLVVRAYIGSD